jgi:FtsH-binding integral membrane protein
MNKKLISVLSVLVIIVFIGFIIFDVSKSSGSEKVVTQNADSAVLPDAWAITREYLSGR